MLAAMNATNGASGVNAEFSDKERSFHLNGIFTTDGPKRMQEGTYYNYPELVSRFVAASLYRSTCYAKDVSQTTIKTMYSDTVHFLCNSRKRKG